jgi:GntR family transcriptional regulator
MESLDFGKGALPLYVQLENIIRSDIENEVYKRNEIIPAEIVFQNRYNISRITVRQAIAALEQEGYVERSRGRGTQVIWRKGIEEEMVQLRSFTTEMDYQHRHVHTENVTVAEQIAPAKIQELFEAKGPLRYVSRVRCADDEPIVNFRTWMPLDMPADPERYFDSLYKLYDDAGVGAPVRTSDTIYAVNADAKTAELLGIEPGKAVMVRQRIGYNARNDVVEYTESYFRSDKYRYYLDLTSEKTR